MAQASPITQYHVGQSYEVLALVQTCRLALDAVRKEHFGEDCGNICAALNVAHGIATELHDAVEANAIDPDQFEALNEVAASDEAVAAAPAEATSTSRSDPLLELIEQFNAGWETYVAVASHAADDFYAKEVGSLLNRLTDACPPATTHAGAMAALRLSLRGEGEEGSPGGIAFLPKDTLVKAALGYLEGGAHG